ncbi:triose-phosphate isomerase [Coxiella endosymbiont of Ornithodoros amblus]|uniref:triose-phosphate isomerase n=1 Tax=Coxiella endosymbiont of Ornithodoros amblus TaxID=1656166 RepID=UPI00244DEC8A|nr:triose-phosphate isomerase [Coxiella endosymbiont of Ornithodoros amblus]MBW5802652.1 triose-phosphate isomerase [Coxiella endosymbiont of Ornithodoros amblus]
MQCRPLVAGNWKMYGSRESVGQLLRALKDARERLETAELAVFPPFVFLQQCKEALIRTQISWGAQDVSEFEGGAYTGEVSATMLRDFHCRYVIVGHSERRRHHGETNEQVAAKVRAALRCGIRPIICVGETEKQRDADQTLSVIKEQLAVVLQMNDNLASLEGMVVAYEPVWAIGTGKNATPSQAEEVHAALRDQLHRQDATLAESTRLLYGGSVKPNNVAPLFEMPNIDGVLVGGASLEAEQFLKIGEQCNQSF